MVATDGFFYVSTTPRRSISLATGRKAAGAQGQGHAHPSHNNTRKLQAHICVGAKASAARHASSKCARRRRAARVTQPSSTTTLPTSTYAAHHLLTRADRPLSLEDTTGIIQARVPQERTHADWMKRRPEEALPTRAAAVDASGEMSHRSGLPASSHCAGTAAHIPSRTSQRTRPTAHVPAQGDCGVAAP